MIPQLHYYRTPVGVIAQTEIADLSPCFICSLCLDSIAKIAIRCEQNANNTDWYQTPLFKGSKFKMHGFHERVNIAIYAVRRS